MTLRIVIFCAVSLVLDFYFYQVVKTAFASKWIRYGYWVVEATILLLAMYQFSLSRSPNAPAHSGFLGFGLLLVLFVPKLLVLPVMLLEDIVRLGKWGVDFFTNKNTFYPERRIFLNQLIIGLSAIPALALLYGMVRGKYNYQVRHITLRFNDLPDSFKGYTITQISDIHIGSFDNEKAVQHGIDLINK